MPLVHDVVSATTELGINLDDAVQNLTAAQRNSSQHYPDDNIVSIWDNMHLLRPRSSDQITYQIIQPMIF